jgi:hypothetical protein
MHWDAPFSISFIAKDAVLLAKTENDENIFSRLSIPDATKWINNLPDSIWCHFSFLSTKHVATTSVLSKRWTLVWLSVLSLSLQFHSDSFLYSLPRLRAHYVSIHSLVSNFVNISCCNQDHVNEFHDPVMPLGIHNLYLHLSQYLYRDLSHYSR